MARLQTVSQSNVPCLYRARRNVIRECRNTVTFGPSVSTLDPAWTEAAAASEQDVLPRPGKKVQKCVRGMSAIVGPGVIQTFSVGTKSVVIIQPQK